MLILDEPANGLDPPGIRWMRELLRSQAARGRAVLVSSHLLSEVAQSADNVVVIARGVLRASGPLESVLGSSHGPVPRVQAAEAPRLAELLRRRAMVVERNGAIPTRHAAAPAAPLLVRGTSPAAVGAVAAGHGIALSELVAVSRSLEDAFLELTAEAS